MLSYLELEKKKKGMQYVCIYPVCSLKKTDAAVLLGTKQGKL